MNEIVAPIVAVLSKFALDRGESILKDAGKAAADAAGRLFDAVMSRLRSDPAEVKTADRFEADPERLAAYLEAALAELLGKDPAFEAKVRALWSELQAAAPETVQIIVTGSGAAASHGGVAAGAGGAAAGPGGTAIVQGQADRNVERRN